jgi:hypothetical protein
MHGGFGFYSALECVVLGFSRMAEKRGFNAGIGGKGIANCISRRGLLQNATSSHDSRLRQANMNRTERVRGAWSR